MIVYWDMVAAFNLITDYLLLLGAAQLAGRTLPKLRLLGAAAFGAAFAVAQLLLPDSPLLTVVSFAIMSALAFFGTGRALKLSMLTLFLSCALGGGLLLLARSCSAAERLSRGLLYAELPWRVFFLTGICTLLLCKAVFRGGARHTAAELAHAEITHCGKSIALTLLCDSGNLLTDPQTGQGVIVVGRSAISPLLPTSGEGQPMQTLTVSGNGEAMDSFLCDNITIDGHALGSRRIAIAPKLYGDGGFQGLWREENGL